MFPKSDAVRELPRYVMASRIKRLLIELKIKGKQLLLKRLLRILEGRKNKHHPTSLVLSQLRLSMKMPLLHLSYPLIQSRPLALTVARFLLVRFLWKNSLPHVTNVLGQSLLYFVLS
jgi:hypothetical protein